MATGSSLTQNYFRSQNSQATIFDLSSNTPTHCLNTIQCRAKIAEFISYGWTVALQWIPSHAVIPNNENAAQKPSRELSRLNWKLLRPPEEQRASSTHVYKYTAMTPKNEAFWKAMGNSGDCVPNSEAPGESRGCCRLLPNYRT
ncbi:hypothetical protein TNCV_637111 [Trichonephila clavipes]|nr:hypothetical protein TNCV_637111 [Trichonephila clavipes]